MKEIMSFLDDDAAFLIAVLAAFFSAILLALKLLTEYWKYVQLRQELNPRSQPNEVKREVAITLSVIVLACISFFAFIVVQRKNREVTQDLVISIAETEAARQAINIDYALAYPDIVSANVGPSDSELKQPPDSIPEAEAESVFSLGGASRDLGGVVGMTTTLLSSVTDADSAEKALLGLKQVDTQLDALLTSIEKAPQGATYAFRRLAESALSRIEPLADNVSNKEDVKSIVEPVVLSIVKKIKIISQI